MAKINEEVLIIKISTLLPDHVDTIRLIDDDKISAIEQVTQELVGSGVVVEIEQA